MAQARTSRRLAGSIRKLPSGRFQARIRGDDGQLRAAPTTFATKVEADRWLASVVTDKAQGRWVDPRAGRVVLRAFAEEWMQGKAALAPKTVELYEYLLARLILPPLGDVEVGDLTPARVRAWRAGLLRAGRPGPSTVAKAYRLLSAMMATAVIDNVVSRNPCVEKGAGVERAPEMRVATPAEVAAIAAAIAPCYRALVLTAAYAGLRWGELAGLTQKNLDLLHRRLTVAEQVIEVRGGELLVREPKSAAGRRVVHLPGGLVAELRHHVAQHVRPDPEGLVFTTPVAGLCARATSVPVTGTRQSRPPAWKGCASTTSATSPGRWQPCRGRPSGRSRRASATPPRPPPIGTSTCWRAATPRSPTGSTRCSGPSPPPAHTRRLGAT